MNVSEIVARLDLEIARLHQAKALLVSASASETKVRKMTGGLKAAGEKIVRRVLSAEAREKIAAAQKRRWAKARRVAKAAAASAATEPAAAKVGRPKKQPEAKPVTAKPASVKTSPAKATGAGKHGRKAAAPLQPVATPAAS